MQSNDDETVLSLVHNYDSFLLFSRKLRDAARGPSVGCSRGSPGLLAGATISSLCGFISQGQVLVDTSMNMQASLGCERKSE